MARIDKQQVKTRNQDPGNSLAVHSALSLPRAQTQSLVRELGSHKPHSVAKKKKKKKEEETKTTPRETVQQTLQAP